MGRDGHVGKDPETLKEKPDGQRLEEASNSFSDELKEPTNNPYRDAEQQKREQRLRENPTVGHVELVDEGPVTANIAAREVETLGTAFYKVGADMGHGISIASISKTEFSNRNPANDFTNVDVKLSNGACLTIRDNHIQDITQADDSRISLLYIKTGDLLWFLNPHDKLSRVEFGNRWEVLAPNEAYYRDPSIFGRFRKCGAQEQVTYQFEIQPNGDFKQYRHNMLGKPELFRTFLIDGTIIYGDGKKPKR